jgi:ATP-dependent exoDNAse (exonuclease V) beta subunit
MSLVAPDVWRPRGIVDLEPNAWHVLRRQENTCVVAGPGAGKTEFLAQRAAYLLETGTCSSPHRVLAISFKTDASENLAVRVRSSQSIDLNDPESVDLLDHFVPLPAFDVVKNNEAA